MTSNEAQNVITDYTYEIEKDPSNFLNTVSGDCKRAVWLLSEKLELVWCSDYTSKVVPSEESILGLGYSKTIPNLKVFIQSLCEGGKTSQGVCRYKDIDYEISCHPINKEGKPKGYVATIAQGMRSQLSGMLDRQKKREEKLCSIKLTKPRL